MGDKNVWSGEGPHSEHLIASLSLWDCPYLLNMRMI